MSHPAPPPPPPPPPEPPTGPPAGPPVTDAAGFFGALFDFSFANFVTPKIVRFVYVLVTVLIGLGWLTVLIAGFAESAGAGIFVLIVGSLAALVYLTFIRMLLEFCLAIVRMSEDINKRLPRG